MTVAAVPVPVSETVCVVGLASSVIVSVAASAEVVDGVKVTLMMHVPPAGATAVLFTHVVPAAMAKSAAFVPLMTTVLEAAKCNVSVPELVNVTVSGPPVVLLGTFPKASGLGVAAAIGKIPVPVKFTT